MRLTYDAILDNPKLLEASLAAARRERAQAMHDFVVAPLKRLFAGPGARPGAARHDCANPA